MRFRGGSAEECRRWQGTFGRKLRELLGPHRPPESWRVDVERVVELPDHRREELLLSARGHPTLPVHLLIPKGAKGPYPGVVAVHGHGPLGYDPVASTPQEFAERIRSELETWAKVVRAANIRAN